MKDGPMQERSMTSWENLNQEFNDVVERAGKLESSIRQIHDTLVGTRAEEDVPENETKAPNHFQSQMSVSLAELNERISRMQSLVAQIGE